MPTVGYGSHQLEFYHPEVGYLRVNTGADRMAWGYSLNTAVYPTYAGEVVQILSCYIDNLEITGSIQTYADLEEIYTYFLRYTQVATQGDPKRGRITGRSAFNQEPMDLWYHHRGWHFEIMPVSVPGFRRAREQTHPEWRIEAHVVDEEGDADEIKDLILQEVEIKAAIGSKDQNFDENFGLTGQIKFLDQNPFSDPFTDSTKESFDAQRSKAFTQIADHYSKMIPAYLDGDFEALFGDLGSQPAFTTNKATATKAANSDGKALQKEFDRIVRAGSG